MPGRPHHSQKMRDCVEQLTAKGHDDSSAYAICTKSLQDAGTPIFEGAEGFGVEDMRELHLRGATGAVRTEMLHGREHIVVPVVALMDTVIHAVNAATPERVPLATLTKAAASWNGRPVVLGHPTRNGRQISANEPGVMSAYGLGTIFNSRVENGKLQMEAWHDVEHTTRIAGQEYVDSIRAAKPHEVSVGAFVVTDGQPGIHPNGKAYKANWIDATGDHLAMLPNSIGACSMAMGCGTHRAAMHLVTAEAIEMVSDVIEDDLETLGDGYNPNRDDKGQFSSGSSSKQFHVRSEPYGHVVGSSHSKEDAHNQAKNYTKTTGVKTTVVDRGKAKSFDPKEMTEDFEHGPQHLSHEAYKASEKAQQSNKSEDHLAAYYAHSAAATAHSYADKPFEKTSLGSEQRDRLRQQIAGHELQAKEHLVASGKSNVSGSGVKKFKGAQMEDKKSIREQIVTLITKLRGAAEDTPADEAAELIQYQTIQALLQQCGDSYDEAMGVVKELIAAEDNETADEVAEEAIEEARLESINAHCLQMMGSLSGIMNISRALLADDADSSYPMVMEAAVEARSLVGKRHSSDDQSMLQVVHDHSVALGADCPTNRELEQHDEDVETLEETDTEEIRAAEHDCGCGKNAANGDTDMVKAERIKNLLATSGYTAADSKWLEQVPDERLTALETQAAQAAKTTELETKLTAAETANAAIEVRLKAAEAAQIPAEELSGLRAMAAAKKATDDARHAELVEVLKTAQAEFTEEELKSQPLASLERFARMTKVETVDQSGRMVPRAAAAEDKTDVFLNPPDGYALAIAARNKTVN